MGLAREWHTCPFVDSLQEYTVSMRIIISANTTWYLWNFRIGLIRQLIKDHHEIFVFAPNDRFTKKLSEAGCQICDLNIVSSSINPFGNLLLFGRYLLAIHHIKPHLVFLFTIKPVVFLGIASRLCRVPAVSTITGLGTVFIRRTWITRLVMRLYVISLRRIQKVFFQNNDDRDLFLQLGLVDKEIAVVLPGSGIDLLRFKLKPQQKYIKEQVVFLFIGRLIKDKGIREYVDAARDVRMRFPNCRFLIAGPTSVDNLTAISSEDIQVWENEGYVEYLGESTDVRSIIENADCVVLPSYREGMPRVLLEAGAIGRPVIASRVTGCHDVVEDGVTGLLCNPRDASDLAEKMMLLVVLPEEERKEMGYKARERIEGIYDERIVIENYVRELSKV